MKNDNELYRNYYNAYKSDYDTNNELTEKKKKKYDYEQFVFDDEINNESKLDEKTKKLKLTKLSKWIKVSEERLNETLNTITEAKSNGLKINVDGKEITLDKAESLLKDIGSGKINGHEFKEKFNDIIDDLIPVLDKSTKNGQNPITVERNYKA